MIRGGTLELSQRDDEVRILRIEVAELQRSIGATMKVRRGRRGSGEAQDPYLYCPATARRGRGAAVTWVAFVLPPLTSPPLLP